MTILRSVGVGIWDSIQLVSIRGNYYSMPFSLNFAAKFPSIFKFRTKKFQHRFSFLVQIEKV